MADVKSPQQLSEEISSRMHLGIKTEADKLWLHAQVPVFERSVGIHPDDRRGGMVARYAYARRKMEKEEQTALEGQL